MLFDDDELGRAIYFFNAEGQVCKEMHGSEFEAILDGYVPLEEWANADVQAAYVEMDSGYILHSAVFFLLSFTESGEVDPGWNLPLDNLTRNASEGPDMGAGPISLACASQCPIHHFRSYLWDPDLHKSRGNLAVLKRAVKKNKLSIQFRDPVGEKKTRVDPQEALISTGIIEKRLAEQMRREYSKELRDQMAQLLKEQRLKENTDSNEYQKEIQSVKTDYANRLEENRQLLVQRGRELQDERTRNDNLQQTIDGQATKIEGLREYFEHKLEKNEGEEVEQIQMLKDNHVVEISAKVEAATTELKQMLEMREVELLYRNERESQLHEEITRLRQENQTILANSGDQLMEKLMAKGISFVTYQPGAGHITIPASEMSRFMENPVAYAAECCGVQEEHYKAWLAHYQAPVCNAPAEGDESCGENIDRISVPVDFHIGSGDRCEKHKELKGAGHLKVIVGKN